jgi:hypothetical protein
MHKTKPVVFVSHSGELEFIQALRTYLLNCETVISDWRDESGPQCQDHFSPAIS